MKTTGYYSDEIDKLFNTKHYTDIIKRPDLAVDEIIFNKPFFATVPLEYQWWLSCNICLGLILIDLRVNYQERPCEKCRNLFKIRKTGFKQFKYQFIEEWRHPEQARIQAATM